MAKVNENYRKLPGSYLFAEIGRRSAAYAAAHPEAKLIKMGIGDVTRPLAPAVIEAMHAAVDDLAHVETFHGYGPEQGYGFLREAIVEGDFRKYGVDISADEVFVSDGAKSDCGNIGDILAFVRSSPGEHGGGYRDIRGDVLTGASDDDLPSQEK